MEDDQPELIHEPLVHVGRETAEHDLASSGEQVMARALLAASFEDEDAWNRKVADGQGNYPPNSCPRVIHHGQAPIEHPTGDFVDESRARVALTRLAGDPVVRPAAMDALGDVEHAFRKGRW